LKKNIDAELSEMEEEVKNLHDSIEEPSNE